MRERTGRWDPVDWAIAAYAGATAVVLVATGLPGGGWWMLATRVGVFAALLLLPPRGAAWESRAWEEPVPRRTIWGAGVLLRYGWPLLAALFFFQEVPGILSALWGEPPWWFEPHLLRAERALFGRPGVAGWPTAAVEAVYATYLVAYYPVVAGGLLYAATSGGERDGRPGAAFGPALAGTVFAFLASLALFLALPARAPRHIPELAADLPDPPRAVFVPVVEWIQGLGGVLGGAFPSAHVAVAWGLVVGLSRHRPRAAALLVALAVGLALATPLTPYHHALDAVAGAAVGVVAGALARRFDGGSG
ncbi:MAG: phosphatase PAP2 family protein [Gemmatimonadota bacterium]|nr:phosphatase PAP2 family protein [Gemmatimonadota bacterium]